MKSLSSILFDELIEEQTRLAQQICVPQSGQGYTPQVGELMVTLDVQYVGDVAFVAADLLQWPDHHVDTIVQKMEVEFPYISQYFCFREGPLLQQMVEHLVEDLGYDPKLLLIDGHGRAHPRLLGIACWVGLKTGLPTIGCAKEPLLRYDKMVVGYPRGSTQPLYRSNERGEGEPLGMVLVTQDGVRPLFVSPGHLVAVETAVEIVLSFASRYRQPEPIRRADQAARLAAKNASAAG